MICTISSRTSPRPPGNWCDARRTVGAPYAVNAIAESAVASAARCSVFIAFLLLELAVILKLYHARSTQAGDLAAILAEQPGEDLLGMLAQHRRREAVFHRRRREAHGARHRRQPARGRVLE